jgi:hypothetical protein
MKTKSEVMLKKTLRIGRNYYKINNSLRNELIKYELIEKLLKFLLKSINILPYPCL